MQFAKKHWNRLSVYEKKYCMYVCLSLKISLTTKLIRFFLIEKLYISFFKNKSYCDVIFFGCYVWTSNNLLLSCLLYKEIHFVGVPTILQMYHISFILPILPRKGGILRRFINDYLENPEQHPLVRILDQVTSNRQTTLWLHDFCLRSPNCAW